MSLAVGSIDAAFLAIVQDPHDRPERASGRAALLARRPTLHSAQQGGGLGQFGGKPVQDGSRALSPAGGDPQR